MRYYIALSLLAAASAARLENVYLPPHSGFSGGASAGLQAPLAGRGQNYAGQPGAAATQNFGQSQSLQNQAEILKYENEITEDGFHYAYETSDGTKAEQEGRVIPGATEDSGSLQVSGSYSYIGDDGQTYTVTYTADENGYQAQGAHLPTPPPIPESILKSLQLTAGREGQYDSQKSSYDADAGY